MRLGSAELLQTAALQLREGKGEQRRMSKGIRVWRPKFIGLGAGWTGKGGARGRLGLQLGLGTFGGEG